MTQQAWRRGIPSRQGRRHRLLWVVAAAVAAVALAAVLVIALVPMRAPQGPDAAGPAAAAGTATAAAASVPPVSAARLRGLPEARYDAVIGGLLPYTGEAAQITGAYRLTHDAPVFGADKHTPVARIAAKDFLGAPTTVVVAGSSGPFDLVLTAARVALPSASHGEAPAQSAGWVPAELLHRVGQLAERIQISTGAQRLTILRGDAVVSSFAVGVGSPGTPTPTGVTGYLQERYLDPRQGETVYPIQLTSLHSAAADEPYGGDDGGLIGVHYNVVNTGAVSHGCVRLSKSAILAVNRLPLGTPVTITT